MIAYICKQMLQGLDYVHKKNKVHRDLKSDNILINKKGEVKLADFGYSLLPAIPAGRARVQALPSYSFR